MTTSPEPPAEFDLIYADPPWAYGNRPGRATGLFGDIERHYPTMTVAEICGLEVPAAKDAVLYLWATAPLLPEALEVLRAWGFTYKSCAVWDKKNPRLGYWWRGQHELLLVGTRGKASPPASELRRSSVFSIKAGRHSAKPDAIRDYIASAFPAARRLEMFARSAAPGWSVWGNEVAPDVALSGVLPAETTHAHQPPQLLAPQPLPFGG